MYELGNLPYTTSMTAPIRYHLQKSLVLLLLACSFVFFLVLKPGHSFIEGSSRLWAAFSFPASNTSAINVMLSPVSSTNITTPELSDQPPSVALSFYSARTLSVASKIYVISLSRRRDRRLRMELLAEYLDNLELTWEDATDANEDVVTEIMERVRWERAAEAIRQQWGIPASYSFEFETHDGSPEAALEAMNEIKGSTEIPGTGSPVLPLSSPSPSNYTLDPVSKQEEEIWPLDAIQNPFWEQRRPFAKTIPSLATALKPSGSDLWTLDLSDPISSRNTNPIPAPPRPDLRPPIPCKPLSILQAHHQASNSTSQVYDDTIPAAKHSEANVHSGSPPHAHEPTESWYHTLSRGMAACWHSHLGVLRHVAEGPDEVAIVLEDDIDMERDINVRLRRMWGALPDDWDLVMLGHCWSSEDTYPSLPGAPSLHPSHSPKCTHAYAVSKTGAARLIAHLRSPSFAYSRPIDQAFEYLIRNRRIRSFSILPGIVIQTKDVPSDIVSGNGSSWRDVLVDGALQYATKGPS